MPPPPDVAAALLHAPGTDREVAVLGAVRGLAAALDLDVDGAGVLRTGTAVVVGLPAAGVLVRVDDGASRRTADRQVAVARALAEAGVAAVRLADVVGDQPLVVDAGPGRSAVPAIVWRWEEVLEGPVEPRALGALARSLHDVEPTAEGAVPPVDPLGAAVEQIEVAAAGDVTAEGDVALLREAAARLAPAWRAVATGERPRLVHGDLHAGNVLSTHGGPVLVDLELSGIGPAVYDLAPQVVAVRRYGAPEADLDAFLDGYGAELPPAAVLEPSVQVFELWVTAWAVANRGVDEDHEAEAELRLARWRPGADLDALPTWTLR